MYRCVNSSCPEYNQVLPAEAVYLDQGNHVRCRRCHAFVRQAEQSEEAVKGVAGLTGGALLGWAVGGPAGALIGGILGGIIGAASGSSGDK